MGVSRGKQFEDAIKKAFLKHPDISFDRFPDPMAGYAGIRNICDFGVYRLHINIISNVKHFPAIPSILPQQSQKTSGMDW